jgi:hypothetical protein
VKTFTYHASTLVFGPRGSLDETTGTGTYTNPADFAANLARLPGSKSLLERFPGSDALKLWQEFTALYAARRDLESHGYVASRLRGLLKLLPNVATVNLCPVSSDHVYVPGEHIPLLSRVDEECFTDLLAACADYVGITALRAERLHWGSFRACDDISRFCSGLRELDLRIDDQGIGYPYSYMRREVLEFLGACHDLERLVLHLGAGELRLRVRYLAACFEAMRAVCGDVLRGVWRRLKRVRLVGFTASEDELRVFFSGHASSLRNVGLERLQFVGSDGRYVPVDNVSWRRGSGSVIDSIKLAADKTGYLTFPPPSS